MLAGTDVCVRMLIVWEETGVSGGNSPVWIGNHMTISHADAGYRTQVAAVSGECVYTAPARQPTDIYNICKQGHCYFGTTMIMITQVS